jgi:hypothetical protein
MNETPEHVEDSTPRPSLYISLRRFIIILVFLLVCLGVLYLLYINGKSIYESGL